MTGNGEQRGGATGSLIRAIRRHMVAVLAVTFLGVLLAVFVVDRREPEYRATAEVLVSPVPEEDRTLVGLEVIRDSRVPARTIETAAILLDSPQAVRRTAAQLDMSDEDVRDRVDVVSRGESNVVDVTATAQTPRSAADMANVFAASAISARRDALERQLVKTLAALRAREAVQGPRTDATAEAISDRITALETLLASGSDPTLSLTQQATLPPRPVGAANWVVIALGTLAGFAIAAVGALALERTSRRIRDESDLTSLYPIPTLARIPGSGVRGTPGETPASDLTPAAREAFRTLAAQLERQRTDEPGGFVLLITSASAGDGKTTVAAALAETLAQAASAVVVVDVNLRRPELAKALALSPRAGLSRVLQPRRVSTRKLLVGTGTPRLRALLAAPRDMASLEAVHRRLPDVISDLRELSDWIVLDTPPLGEVSDALRLLGETDGVILVSRLGNTDRMELEHARDLLERGQATPMGAVIFGAPAAASSVYDDYAMTGQRS
jgi:Mrp family chromosome partitioning ATPase/capsular polysaccharide biosynthesis protein